MDGWAGLTGVLVWICFGALAAAEWRPARAPGLRRLAWSTAALIALTAVSLALAWQERRAYRNAAMKSACWPAPCPT